MFGQVVCVDAERCLRLPWGIQHEGDADILQTDLVGVIRDHKGVYHPDEGLSGVGVQAGGVLAELLARAPAIPSRSLHNRMQRAVLLDADLVILGVIAGQRHVPGFVYQMHPLLRRRRQDRSAVHFRLGDQWHPVAT